MIAIVNGICVIIEAVSLFIYYSAILKETKVSRLCLLIIYIIWTAVAFALVETIESVPLLSTLMLVTTAAPTLCYVGKSWVKIFAAAVFHTMSFLLESIVGFTAVGLLGVEISNITANENAYFMMVTITKFLLFAFCVAVFYVCKRKRFLVSKTPVLLLTFLPVATILVILQIGTTAGNNSKITAIISYAALIFANFVTFYLFERQSTFEENKLQNENLQRQVQLQVEHYKELGDESAKIRTLRHNLKNMFICLHGLLESNQIEDAKGIITSQTEEILATGLEIDTGNVQIDSVINAKQRKIAYKIDTKIHKLEIDLDIEFDIAVMIALALDNAVEANQNENNPKAGVVIIPDNNMLIIQIENSFSGNLCEEENKLISTKKDKKMHGYGFETIRFLAEKHNGSATYLVDNGIFSTNIFIEYC